MICVARIISQSIHVASLDHLFVLELAFSVPEGIFEIAKKGKMEDPVLSLPYGKGSDACG